jgi:DNA-binding GntR family transcriptional regulator
MALELEVVRAAVEWLTPDGAERIKQHLAHEVEDIKRTRELGRARGDLPTHDFHLLLADLTGNPAMRLFVQVVAQVTGALSPRSPSLDETASEVHRTHQRIAEAILDGDVDAAERRMRRHLETVVRYLVPEGARAPKPRRAAATRRRGGV